jgi:hypothetical protein
MKADSCIPIKKISLERFAGTVDAFLEAVTWIPATTLNLSGPKEKSEEQQFLRFADPTPKQSEYSILKIAKGIEENSIVLPDRINHTLRIVRTGFMLGQEMTAQYAIASGLVELARLNKKEIASDAQKAEYQQKWITASAAGLFSASCFIVSELSKYETNLVADVNIHFGGIPEVCLTNNIDSARCALFYYGAYLGSGVIKNDLDFIKITLLYFEAMINEIKLRAGGLKYSEPFTDQSYKLENSEFTIRGFEFQRIVHIESRSFNHVEAHEIVGNRDMKHKVAREVAFIMCMNFETGKNPVLELGGLPSICLGYGPAGTGKSMSISFAASEIEKRCLQRGIPFLFWPFPDTPISEFQGKSAQIVTEWFQPLTEKPSRIIYATIDDAENVLEERTRQGVSEGARGVVGVLLRYWEGAYAPHYGNSLTHIFTNIPEQIDRAVLSRVNDRFLIAGAQTVEDFLDQEKLWYKKYEAINPNFVNMKDPKGYEYFSTQGSVKSIGEIYKDLAAPENEDLKKIFERVHKKYDVNEHMFFGQLFYEVQQQFSLFTSRDVRNIDGNISSRIMDFDLPEEWFENLELFFKKEYKAQVGMLTELMEVNMKGLSLADIRLQESILYLDNMVRMANQAEEREIERRVKDILLNEKVSARLAAARNR